MKGQNCHEQIIQIKKCNMSSASIINLLQRFPPTTKEEDSSGEWLVVTWDHPRITGKANLYLFQTIRPIMYPYQLQFESKMQHKHNDSRFKIPQMLVDDLADVRIMLHIFVGTPTHLNPQHMPLAKLPSCFDVFPELRKSSSRMVFDCGTLNSPRDLILSEVVHHIIERNSCLIGRQLKGECVRLLLEYILEDDFGMLLLQLPSFVEAVLSKSKVFLEGDKDVFWLSPKSERTLKLLGKLYI